MSKSKLAAEPELPAPLSLTLDEVREVAGGAATLASVVAMDHWWWYGQPANPWVSLVNQPALGGNLAGGQLGAGQVFGR